MLVSRNSWHYKVFDWWFKSKHSWRWEEYYSPVTEYNLCPYMRAVLIWAPIRFFFLPPRLWGTIPTLFAVLNWWIYHHFGLLGWKHFLIVLGTGSGSAGFFVAFILFLIYLQDHPTGAKQGISNFFELLGEWLAPTHDKICPPIKFVGSWISPTEDVCIGGSGGKEVEGEGDEDVDSSDSQESP